MQVPAIAERRSSGWARTGTLMGGTDDSDTNPKMSENSMDIEDLALPPGGDFSVPVDEISINNEGESSSADTDDDYTGLGDGYESALEYGADDENLIDGLHDELERMGVEEEDLAQSRGNLTVEELNSSILLSEKMALSMSSAFEGSVSADEDDKQTCDEHSNYDGSELDHFGFLKKLDQNFFCGPRMLVRGEYAAEGILNLVSRRKTEGTYVDWSMMDLRRKKQVLLVKGEMRYPFGLSRDARSSKHGHNVRGGWMYEGFGYGYVNLFPGSDTSLAHIDIEESIFPFEHHTTHHLSGRSCKNMDKAEDIICKEGECGARIWSIKFTSYVTAEEEVPDYMVPRWRKEKQGQVVFLSLVAFFSGNYKIVVHRDADLQNSFDVNQRQVAWLTQVKKQRFDDSPKVDLLKLNRAQITWGTRVPKPSCTEDHSNTQVIFPE